MNKREFQNKGVKFFENKLTKKIVIGIVVLAVVVAALKTALQMMAGNPMPLDNSGLESEGAMAQGLGGGSPMIGAPSVGGMRVKSAVQDSVAGIVAPIMPDSSASVADKKVIKQGDLSLKVGSVDNATEDIAGIARSNSGDVFSSNIYNRNNIKSGNILVKVPVGNFEKTFSEIKKVSSLVIRESTTGQDVTEEYADLQSQLKNKQIEETQYQTILQQAQKIQDVLDVTQYLYRVRGEIEQLQGRINYLNSQTDMSSISVALSEDQNITVTDSWRPWQVAKDAVNALIKKIQEFITLVIVLIVTVLPITILYLIGIYLIFWIARKIYRKARGNK